MYSVFLIAAIVLLDQTSKIAVRALMTEGESIKVIGSFFSLTYIRNDGAAFSSFSGQKHLLILVSAVLVAAGIAVLYRTRGKSRLLTLSLCMIVGGGIGNLIDRLLFGAVTDMLSFSIFKPVFNVADIGVTVGAALLILYVILGERRKGGGR